MHEAGPSDSSAPPPTISYLGHETLLLQMDGVRLLTDPVLRLRLPLLQRFGPVPDPGVARGLDAVIISHLHLDHVNPASLRLLPTETPLVVPAGAGRMLRRYRFREVHELKSGDSVKMGGLTIVATPARHRGRRYPWGREADVLGYLIRGSLTVYFAGDTGLFPGMAGLAEDLDVALVPIWGWGLRLPDDHLSPEQAARALRFLRPRIAIPIHWGTFLPWGAGWLYSHYLTRPPLEFVKYAREYAPEVIPAILRPAETMILAPAPPGAAGTEPGFSGSELR